MSTKDPSAATVWWVIAIICALVALSCFGEDALAAGAWALMGSGLVIAIRYLITGKGI